MAETFPSHDPFSLINFYKTVGIELYKIGIQIKGWLIMNYKHFNFKIIVESMCYLTIF